ncbi:hypothetical protein R3P38DRAFT_3231302 [Favolaschia claudopus]|uniref:JmjC domain-containing protein n=1 Tax=Favolaschia claudopus TaxID=2862362 RepID=A0AAV9ZL05_9AGAR
MSPSLFSIDGPWNHALCAKASKQLFDGRDVTAVLEGFGFPADFVGPLAHEIVSWSTRPFDDLDSEFRQTALRFLRLSTEGNGVMNRYVSPAIRHGILPIITLDLLLYSADPAQTAPPRMRQLTRPFSSTKHKNHFLKANDWYQVLSDASEAHRERKKISKRPRTNLAAIADGRKKSCLRNLSLLNSTSKPGDVAIYNLTQAAFMLRAMRHGKMVLTLESFIDLGLLQAREEDPSVTREEVEGVLVNPNVEGIPATLAVAASISPVYLLSGQNYASGTYNPSTSVYDYWSASGNMQRVDLEHPLGKVERVCWIALLRLAARVISAEEAMDNIFDSAVVQSVLNNEPSEPQLQVLSFPDDTDLHTMKDMDPDDDYEVEMARRIKSEREREEKEKADKEEAERQLAENERLEKEKAEKEQKDKEEREKKEAEKKRRAEEKRADNLEAPPTERRMTRSQDPATAAKAKVVQDQVSSPPARAPRSRGSAAVGVSKPSVRVPKNAYIHVIDDVVSDEREQVSLDSLEPLDFAESRPMHPEPMHITIYAPGSAPGQSVERTFEYRMFKKFARDRNMIEAMLQSEPTPTPLFLQDSARNPDPLLQASESQSVLFVSTQKDYAKLSRSVKFEIHRRRCVLIVDVTGDDEAPPPFDWDTMQAFRNPEMPCHIQDMGVAKDSGDAYLRAGPLRDLLPKEGRPVLNAIHHPLSSHQMPSPPGFSHFCSLGRAMMSLNGHRHLPTVAHPWGDLRWGLCATALARTGTHQDIAATEMTVLVGEKMIILGVPRVERFESSEYRADLGSRFSFLNWEAVQEDAQTDIYRWEAFCLRPNMAFYMRPGTPHFVISLEDTIAYGSHTINAAQIQAAVFSVLHNFVTEGFHANAEHRVLQWLLVRMSVFWSELIPLERPAPCVHYPNIGTPDGLLDLLTLHCYLILYPALLIESYQGMSSVPGTFGAAPSMCSTRYQEYDYALYAAACLENWIDTHKFVNDRTPGKHPKRGREHTYTTLLHTSVVNMACCLVRYRTEWIERQRANGGSVTAGFTVTAFKQQLHRAMAAYEHCSGGRLGGLSDFSPQNISLKEGRLAELFDGEMESSEGTDDSAPMEEGSGESSHTHFMPWDLYSRPFACHMRTMVRAVMQPSNSSKRLGDDVDEPRRKRRRV